MSDDNVNDYGNKNFGRKRKFKMPFTENINDNDFIVLKRDQTTEELWIRYEDLKEEILSNVVIPDIEPAVSFMIDYETEVQLLATWFVGNYEKRVSTETASVSHTGVAKWHLSRLDINGINLDLPNNTVSLWDYIISAVEGTNVLIKVYNREDKSQYVYLNALGDTFLKENPDLSDPSYYDLEFSASVIKTNGLVSGTIQNPTVAIIIGRQLDVVRNRTDNYTSLPKQEYAVTLTASEYAAMGSGRPDTTVYMVPCDGTAPIIYLEDNSDVDFGELVDGDLMRYNGTTMKWENVSIINKSLPTYENNSAAISGGLTVNAWYKTSTGEVRIVV